MRTAVPCYFRYVNSQSNNKPPSVHLGAHNAYDGEVYYEVLIRWYWHYISCHAYSLKGKYFKGDWGLAQLKIGKDNSYLSTMVAFFYINST